MPTALGPNSNLELIIYLKRAIYTRASYVINGSVKYHFHASGEMGSLNAKVDGQVPEFGSNGGLYRRLFSNQMSHLIFRHLAPRWLILTEKLCSLYVKLKINFVL